MQSKEVVAIILFDRQKNIILQDRKAISKYGEERSLFGGHLEIGEDIATACIRESKEELQINLKEENINYIGTVVHFMYDRKVKYIRHLCLIQVENLKDMKLKDYEGSGLYIFNINEISSLKFNTSIDQEVFLVNYHINNYSKHYNIGL